MNAVELVAVSIGGLLAAHALRAWRRARRARARLHDERGAEDVLRAQAEAVLAAQLERGEIDRATYQRLRLQLWHLPAPTPEGEASPATAPKS